MRIPFVDLALQHAEIAAEIESGFARVLREMSLILNEDVARFEADFARFCGRQHCVAVASGTDALELMLRAVGIARDDEVILPTNSYIATALAVVRAGAVPVLVDCEPGQLLIDVERVEQRIGPRTRAILAVDLYGQIAEMEALAVLADAHGLLLLEDAAQAHGATRHGLGIGSRAHAAAISFYPGKNLGAYGDAGGVLTDDQAVSDRVRALRNYGSVVRYHHPEMGFNSRMDSLQAVVLNAKLRRLHAWNEERRLAAARYAELLSDLPQVSVPGTMTGNCHVWHLYVVRIPHRDAVLSRLNQSGIGAAIHYPKPIHLQGAFQSLGHTAGDFPISEAAAAEILSLPMYPGITPDQQAEVVEHLRRALSES